MDFKVGKQILYLCLVCIPHLNRDQCFQLQDPHTRLCYDQALVHHDTDLITYFLMLSSERMLILYN